MFEQVFGSKLTMREINHNGLLLW